MLNICKVRRTGTRFFSFHTGIDGVYLANRLAPRHNHSVDVDCIQTVITYNAGASWALLDAGDLCRDSLLHCSMHFFGASVQYGAIYSAKKAVGVWFGQGHVGECLGPPPSRSSVSTFFSSDAGQTWALAANGSVTYEITASGGFLTTAEANAPTRNFNWTVDYGRTWQACALRNPRNESDAVIVHNILTPGYDARWFLLEGHTASNGGFVQRIELSSATPLCAAAPLQPDGKTPNAEFELFAVTGEPLPSNAAQRECVMGRHLVYVRRKPSAHCYAAKMAQVPVLETPCVCTESDWECDVCFVRGPMVDLRTLGECVEEHQEAFCQKVSGKKKKKTIGEFPFLKASFSRHRFHVHAGKCKLRTAID